MAWYSVVLKTHPSLPVRLDVRSYFLRFPIQAAMNELHIQYLVPLCDPCRLRGKKSEAEQGSAVSCCAGRLYSGEFQTFQTEQILSLKFVSHLEVISGAFCF